MGLSYRQIGEEYNQEMLGILLDSPMENDGLSVCLDRSPDMFAVPKLFFDSYKAFGFFMDERLVGFIMICRKKVYVNGMPREIGYLANMYIRPEGRKKGWLYKVSEPLFKEALEEVGIGYATTMVGNRNTEPMIGRKVHKFPFIPYSKSIGVNYIFNILVTFRKRNRTGYTVRRAEEADLPEISRLLEAEYRPRLFGPLMDIENLKKTIANRPGFTVSDYFVAMQGTRIVGVCSAWDISPIRKLRVMAYRKQYRWVKLGYSLVAPIFGFPRLPRPGDPFREVVINDHAVENRDPRILKALITEIYQEYRSKGYNMVQIGSYEGDPVMEAAKGFFSQPLCSHIIFGAKEEEAIEQEGIDCSAPYLDIALT
jgi:hypothetical protein